MRRELTQAMALVEGDTPSVRVYVVALLLGRITGLSDRAAERWACEARDAHRAVREAPRGERGEETD